MTTIEDEIAAYETMQAELEAEHMGKWVLLQQGKLIDVFASPQEAAEQAVRRFGRGPYLIRQVGAGAMSASLNRERTKAAISGPAPRRPSRASTQAPAGMMSPRAPRATAC